MKKLLILLALTGCSDAPSEMRACKEMCKPRMVKAFSPAKEHAFGDGSPSCICDEKEYPNPVEKP